MKSSYFTYQLELIVWVADALRIDEKRGTRVECTRGRER